MLQIADPSFAALSPDDQDSVLRAAFIGGVTPTPTLPQRKPETYLSESGLQTREWLKGMKALLNFGGAPAAEGGTSSPLGTLGWGLYNLVTGTGRELLAMPQPGKSVLTAPTTMIGEGAGKRGAELDPRTGRFPRAWSFAMGGDPAEARARELSGEKGASVAALTTVPLLNMGISKLAEMVIPETEGTMKNRALSLTSAIGGKGKSVNYVEAFQTSLPELLKTQRMSGNIARDPVGLAKLVRDTGARLQNEFALRMQPIANQPKVPIEVANALKAEAQKFMTGRAADKAVADYLNKEAIEFQKPYTWGQLDQARMNARGRISGHLTKSPTKQMAAERSSEEILKETIVHDTIRDLEYDALEKYWNRPDYFRQLKAKQSAMLEITDQMAARLNELGNNEAYDTLLGRIRGHSYVSPHGFGFALGNVLAAPFSEKGAVNRSIRQGTRPKIHNRPAIRRALRGASSTVRQSQPSLAPDEEQQ